MRIFRKMRAYDVFECEQRDSARHGPGRITKLTDTGQLVESTVGVWIDGVLGPHRVVDDDTGSVTEAVHIAYCRTAACPNDGVWRKVCSLQDPEYGVVSVSVRPSRREVRLTLKRVLSGAAEPNACDVHLPHFCYGTRLQKPIVVPGPTWRKALVFVHGFNICVHDVARQLGQLIVLGELPTCLTPIVFGWPCSKGASYFNGKRAIYDDDAVVNNFVDFLVDLKRSGCEEVHLLVHSLGAAVVCRALEKPESTHGVPELATITLLHPDLPLSDFNAKWAYLLRKRCPVVTIMADRRDGALWYSEFFNRTRAAGRRPRDITTEADVDVLDVTNVDAHRHKIGHNMFTLHPCITRDLRAIVADKARASERLGLTHMGGKRWMYRAPTRRSKNP